MNCYFTPSELGFRNGEKKQLGIVAAPEKDSTRATTNKP